MFSEANVELLKSIIQQDLAKAVGEGNVAALSACDWLDRKQ